MSRPIHILLFLLFVQLVPSRAENTGILYTTPQDSKDGFFVFPRTYPFTFREGSSINISWTTTYRNVNLFYYQRGNVANSIQLATNQAISWYQWQVSAQETNLTEPFVFRVVNGEGSNAEVKGGGFWSTSYYISRFTSVTSSAPRSTVAVTLVSSSSSAPASSSSIIPPSTPSRSEQVPSTTHIPQNPSTEATQLSAAPQPGNVSRKTIIGMAVGISIAFLIMVGSLAFACFRRQQRRAGENPKIEAPLAMEQSKDHDYTLVTHEVYVSPVEMEGSRTCFELPVVKGSPRTDAHGVG